MEKDNKKGNLVVRLLSGMHGMVSRLTLLVGLAAMLAVTLLLAWMVKSCSSDRVETVVSDTINITPAHITAMKNIGEWEFLTITDEEMTDTTRRGFFSDDHLIRIYYGKLRLGINMHKVKPRWITAVGDSVSVNLPAVELLDEDFIDETRTLSFFEAGKWSDADRDALYRRAYTSMRQRCLTKDNIANARENARVQFLQMMKSMGFKKIRIVFEEEKG